MIITVLCCENTKLTHQPLNSAIKMVEGVDFSHYAFLIDEYVYEAVAPRSRQIHYSEWRKNYWIVRTYTIEVNSIQLCKILDIIATQLNIPYSFAQIFKILIGNIFHLKFKKDFNGKKALICSEFVARPLAEVLGYMFPISLDHIGMDEVEDVLKKNQF